MTNVYLTDSNEETIVDFVMDHEELYNKNYEAPKELTERQNSIQDKFNF